jgi:hypothetical protein
MLKVPLNNEQATMEPRPGMPMSNTKRGSVVVLVAVCGALCVGPGWGCRGIYAAFGIPASGWYRVAVTNTSHTDVEVRAVLLQAGYDDWWWDHQRELAGWVTEIRHRLAPNQTKQFAFPTDNDPWHAAGALIAQRGDTTETFESAVYHVVWPTENGRPVFNRRELKIPVEINESDFGEVESAEKVRTLQSNDSASDVNHSAEER